MALKQFLSWSFCNQVSLLWFEGAAVFLTHHYYFNFCIISTFVGTTWGHLPHSLNSFVILSGFWHCVRYNRMTSRCPDGVFSFLNSITSQVRESFSMPFLGSLDLTSNVFLVLRRNIGGGGTLCLPQCLKKKKNNQKKSQVFFTDLCHLTRSYLVFH